MGQNFRVAYVDAQTNDWGSQKGGSFTAYRCNLDGVEGQVEVNKKRGNTPPKVGDDIFGRLEPKTVAGYAWRFFSEQQESNGGSTRADLSPEAQQRIDAIGRVKGRCHAQGVAGQILGARISEIADDEQAMSVFLNGPYKRLVNWLVTDANTAREAA